MSSSTPTKPCCRHKGSAKAVACAAVGGLLVGALTTAFAYTLHTLGKRKKRGGCPHSGERYTIADQPARFARDKAAKNARVLDIDSVFEPQKLQGKVVLVTGANRGLGLAIARAAAECDAEVIATCRSASEELRALPNCHIVEGIDVTEAESMEALVAAVRQYGSTVDVLINNAGYFMVEQETLATAHFEEEMKMIDICAIGSLRVTAALWNAELVTPDTGKIIMITSQGGSISWRPVQNAPGPDFVGDYGHHMSKAANNMMGKLVSLELQGKVPVGIFHPGFNCTDMTRKYEHIWEIEGAVDPSVGAKRVLHEVNLLTHETSGKFINCEDGLEIPW